MELINKIIEWLIKLAANPHVTRDNYFYGSFIKKKIAI